MMSAEVQCDTTNDFVEMTSHTSSLLRMTQHKDTHNETYIVCSLFILVAYLKDTYLYVNSSASARCRSNVFRTLYAARFNMRVEKELTTIKCNTLIE